MLDKIIDFIKRYKPRKYGCSGDFKTWELAKSLCEGYDDSIILERIIESTLKVRNGESAWELDGINYNHINYSYPLLSHLMLIAARDNGNLSLIDFGGSLGTTYFQNRKYLKDLNNVRWTVVEQPHFVKAGTEKIAFENLDFKETLEIAFQKNGSYNTFLTSGVIPYLPEPYEFLNHVKSLEFKTVIIDNTYFNNKEGERICIQKVDPMFYGKALSYPCRFLDYEKVKSIFLDKYDLFQEYDTGIQLYLDNKTIEYKSLVFNLKED